MGPVGTGVATLADADGIALADGAAVVGAEALVVGAVVVGVSPPHAAKQTSRVEMSEDVRMCASRNGPSLRNQAMSASLVVTFVASVSARANADCTELPVLTPAAQTASDLRCFGPDLLPKRAKVDGARGHGSIFPAVLATVGGMGIGSFIGFRLGGSALLDPRSDAVRNDYAVANVALSIGVTALVTGIVLLLVSERR